MSVERIAFRVPACTDAACDLTASPLSADASHWSGHVDYSASQALGDIARGAAVQTIVYQSVCDPEQREKLAIICYEFFKAKRPVDSHSCHVLVRNRERVEVGAAVPWNFLAFTLANLANDLRMANWLINKGLLCVVLAWYNGLISMEYP